MLLVHIVRNGTPLFPAFPENKIPALLHARSILPSDHFWHDGMAEWTLVAERWTAAAAPAPAPEPTVTSLPPFAARSLVTTSVQVSVTPPRRNRPSFLNEAKKRYYETLAPWGETAVTAPKS